MLASNSSPSHYTPFAYALQQRRREVLAKHPVVRHYAPSRVTYDLQQRRKTLLVGHSSPVPSRSDLLTSYINEGGQCRSATQHSGTELHLDRIRLLPTAAKAGSVSRPLSNQALDCILVGFTYNLQQLRRAVLAGHTARRRCTPSRPDSLTNYRAALASHSALGHYTLSRLDVLTLYSSEVSRPVNPYNTALYFNRIDLRHHR